VPADRRVAAGLVSLTLALVLGACGEPPARPEASPSTAPSTTAESPTTAARTTSPPSTRPSPPVRVEIPSIGVASRLVRLGLNADGTMEVPRDYGLAGWFTGGAMPGQDGPAVISGHVDSKSGPAVFHRLRELRPGDTIRVQRADGDWVVFEVTTTARYAKAEFPTDAVFGPVTGPVLRVITCGGQFDRSSGHYLDNVVVTARPASRRSAGPPPA
jgi:sortase (surface protein transpeptidase)